MLLHCVYTYVMLIMCVCVLCVCLHICVCVRECIRIIDDLSSSGEEDNGSLGQSADSNALSKLIDVGIYVIIFRTQY